MKTSRNVYSPRVRNPSISLETQDLTLQQNLFPLLHEGFISQTQITWFLNILFICSQITHGSESVFKSSYSSLFSYFIKIFPLFYSNGTDHSPNQFLNNSSDSLSGVSARFLNTYDQASTRLLRGQRSSWVVLFPVDMSPPESRAHPGPERRGVGIPATLYLVLYIFPRLRHWHRHQHSSV